MQLSSEDKPMVYLLVVLDNNGRYYYTKKASLDLETLKNSLPKVSWVEYDSGDLFDKKGRYLIQSVPII